MGGILCEQNQMIDEEGFYADGHFELYGDIISPHTRAILVMLMIGKVNFKFIPINRLHGEHLHEPYSSMFPSGDFPILVDGYKNVHGGASLTVVKHLSSRLSRCRLRFCLDDYKMQMDMYF